MSEIRWKRLVAEGAAIVLSILLAFSIDAWWEDRQQRSEEAVVLAHLLEQLRERQSFREGRERYLTAILDACRKLLEIARNPDVPVTDREIDYLLNDVTYIGGSLNADIAALSWLYDSGTMSIIESGEITQQLAELRFAIAIEDGFAKREVAFLDSRFYPFLDGNSSVAQIYGADDGVPGYTPEEKAQWSQYPLGSEVVTESTGSHRDLLANREFQNLLVQRTFGLNSLIGWADEDYNVDESLRVVIDLIEEELEGQTIE